MSAKHFIFTVGRILKYINICQLIISHPQWQNIEIYKFNKYLSINQTTNV